MMKAKAICHKCKEVVSCRLEERDVGFANSEETTKEKVRVNSLVCENCDSVVAVPHSETPKIMQLLMLNQSDIFAKCAHE